MNANETEDQRFFTDQIEAITQASKLSEDGNYYAIIQRGEDYIIYQDKNPGEGEDETLIAVYKDGEQCDWDEIY